MPYLLNSPVLTSYGNWRFEGPVGIVEARAFIAEGFTSAIGHEASAKLLSLILGVDVQVNRIAIVMQVGDSALVLRIKTRLSEGMVLDADALADLPWELAKLTRLT